MEKYIYSQNKAFSDMQTGNEKEIFFFVIICMDHPCIWGWSVLGGGILYSPIFIYQILIKHESLIIDTENNKFRTYIYVVKVFSLIMYKCNDRKQQHE